MKPSRKVGQGKKRSHDRAFNDTRLVPDISNWPSSLSTASSTDQYILSPSSTSGDSDNSSVEHWDITLDRDLYETIINLYPEWFGQHMAEEVPPEGMISSPGSPRSVVDEASIQKAMERNKESLKVKLLLRRPISQLVEQGILPPLKASPVFYEQSKKLERARMEDFLKHKIQRRPDRQALIEQHILEDTSISPGLQDKQRQLKKARLADDLNDRLSHRPGPLELIKGNILVADERVAQAIKEGAIHFKATCEGEPVKHPPPLFHLEDPETSSDGTRSPQDLSPPIAGPSFPTNEIGTTPNLLIQPPAVSCISSSSTPSSSSPSSSSIQIAPVQLANIFPVTSSTSTAPSSSVFTLTTFNTTTSTTTLPGANNQIQNVPQFKPIFTTGTSTPSNKSDSSKQRKKSKSKVQPKTRTIKFHEYKGPPNAQKNSESSSASQIESSYELMLKQQQLLLQLELEWQQKMANGIILTSTQNQEQSELKINSQSIAAPNSTQTSIQACNNKVPNTVVTFETPLPKTIANVPPPPVLPVASTSSATSNSAPASKVVSKLEDLKVNDLKIQLKKRSLTVSGSKPQLIERLKPYADEVIASVRALMKESSTKRRDEPQSPASSSASPMSDQQKMSVPVSPEAPMDVEDKCRKTSSDPMDVNDNYIEFQQSQHPPAFVSTFNIGDVPAITATPFNNGFIINEDILKLQQKRIEQLQRELENSQQQQLQQQQQFHFQLQHPFSFHPQAQTISIPLASIATPQFQVISAAAPNPNLVTLRAEPQPPTNPPPPPVIQKSSEPQQTKSQNQRRHSHTVATNREPNAAARKTSASVKASLAAFLHSQQAAAAQQANSQSTTTRSEPHTPEPASAVQGLKTKGRANSLSATNTACLPTGPNTLPAFSKPQATNGYQRPPPPNYEEATREIVKKEVTPRKKSVKSQAVDDVLEILIKNGELPESAAQEPPTPVDKCSKSNVFNGAPIHQQQHPSPSASTLPSHNLPCNNSVTPKDEQRVGVEQETIVVKDSTSGDMSLDLDFALDLQELADSMDLSDMTHSAPEKNCSNFWMPDLGLNPSEAAKKNTSSTNNEVSLNELMEAANSVDWFSDLMSNNNNNVNNNNQMIGNNQINNHHYRSDDRCREVPSDSYNTRMYNERITTNPVTNGYSVSTCYDNHGKSIVNSSNQSLNSSGSSSCSSSYAAKDHDPVLPNNMMGTTSTTDPLIDLFFDESDFKTSHDLNVWDRLDFAT